MGAIAAATTGWDRATRAWSRDDGSNPERTGTLGENVLHASIDLICAQEVEIDRLRAALAEMVEATTELARAINFAEPTENLSALMLAEGRARAARNEANAALSANAPTQSQPTPEGRDQQEGR